MKWKEIFLGLLVTFFSVVTQVTTAQEILNVSYDPTREFYEAYNKTFIQYWKEKSGKDVTINQSHGGSGAQARAVINGLPADVATLALAYDIDLIAEKAHLLPNDWQKKLPNNSCPYTSTILFLVKKGNPKHIHDWSDLIRPDVQVITPNPKTSGGARWNFLAAWGYAMKKNAGDENAAKDFMRKLFKNVPVLDTGARGSTTTFAERSIGDVLIAWENEAYLVLKEFGADKFEIVTPSMSILAEPPVALLQQNAEKRNTTQVATAYLNYLYSKAAQILIAQYYYRPSDREVFAQYAGQFAKVNLFTIKDLGGWERVQNKFFVDGGIFDQIYQS